MITVLINLFVALCVGLGLTLSGLTGWGWGLVAGVLTLVAGQVGLGWLLKRRMGALSDQVQAVMARAQAQMQAKVKRWQTRQMANPKAAEAELAKDRDAMIAEVQALLRPLERYRLWVPFLGRQLATMELQFAWQRKDFKRVDALLPRALLLDPSLACIKLARLWQREAPAEALAKAFAKAVRRTRYDTSALLYATYAWMLVKRGAIDEAFRVLREGDERNENATLKANLGHLANNRLAHFSNAGFGEMWYALWLEEPKFHPRRARDMGRYFG
ncbi:MAG: hypothetical protein ACI4RT_07760 [Candidatus Spyradenecus sp.]